MDLIFKKTTRTSLFEFISLHPNPSYSDAKSRRIRVDLFLLCLYKGCPRSPLLFPPFALACRCPKPSPRELLLSPLPAAVSLLPPLASQHQDEARPPVPLRRNPPEDPRRREADPLHLQPSLAVDSFNVAGCRRHPRDCRSKEKPVHLFSSAGLHWNVVVAVIQNPIAAPTSPPAAPVSVSRRRRHW